MLHVLLALDRAQNGLVPIRVESWECFVFVNLDPEAEPLQAFLGGLVKRISPLGISKLPRHIPPMKVPSSSPIDTAEDPMTSSSS